jgi:23S rRNA pseudouridine2605 synthase
VSEPQRLQKLLAAAGLGSRRSVEQWIEAGRVTVNGVVAKLGDRARPEDDVRLDGKPIALAAKETARRLLIYHKPVGEVTTRSDPQGRPTVFDHLPSLDTGRWISIGRLDVETSGLLLFTTDGALANRLMHPSHEVEREYVAVVRGRPTQEMLDRLLAGVQLEEGPARFDRLAIEGTSAEGTIVRVTLHEGRNREVRRLFAAVGHHVLRLQRVRYGPVILPRDLPPGRWREAAPSSLGGL